MVIPTRNKSLIVLHVVLAGGLIVFYGLRIIPEFVKLRGFAMGRFSIKDIFVIDENKMRRGTQAKTLNQLIPDFDSLVIMNDQGKLRNKEEMMKFQRYYQRLVEYYPQSAEAQGILGFCYYHLDEPKEAVVALKKAVELNPSFFYSYFNLGLIYRDLGEGSLAKEYFEKGCRLANVRGTLITLASSKIYQQVKNGSRNFPQDLERRLHEAYEQCLSWRNQMREGNFHIENQGIQRKSGKLKIF